MLSAVDGVASKSTRAKTLAWWANPAVARARCLTIMRPLEPTSGQVLMKPGHRRPDAAELRKARRQMQMIFRPVCPRWTRA